MTARGHLELVTQIAHKVNAAEQPEEVLELAVTLIGRTFGFIRLRSSALIRPHGKLWPRPATCPNWAWRPTATAGRCLCGCQSVGDRRHGRATFHTVVSNSVVDDGRYLSTFGDMSPDFTHEHAGRDRHPPSW